MQPAVAVSNCFVTGLQPGMCCVIPLEVLKEKLAGSSIDILPSSSVVLTTGKPLTPGSEGTGHLTETEYLLKKLKSTAPRTAQKSSMSMAEEMCSQQMMQLIVYNPAFSVTSRYPKLTCSQMLKRQEKYVEEVALSVQISADCADGFLPRSLASSVLQLELQTEKQSKAIHQALQTGNLEETQLMTVQEQKVREALSPSILSTIESVGSSQMQHREEDAPPCKKQRVLSLALQKQSNATS